MVIYIIYTERETERVCVTALGTPCFFKDEFSFRFLKLENLQKDLLQCKK